MLLSLSTRHAKKIAFFLCYLFLLSPLCSFVYGGQYRSSVADRTPYSEYYRAKNKKALHLSTEVPGNERPVIEEPGSVKKRTNKQTAKNRTDIGGPSQPEMSAFKPVGSDNMVDPFSGDFSYNIPLLDVGGYPVNIFYNSGITMDQEASWCGLGWNINPGTINRNMRGLPDDFKETDIITKTQYTRPDQTWGVNVGGRTEIFGGALGIGIDGGIFYNNMRGLGLEAGINPAISIGGKSGDPKTAPLTMGWSLNANSQSGGSSTFNISLADNNKKGLDGSLNASIGFHSRQGLQALHIDGEVKNMNSDNKNQYSIASGNVQYHPTLGTNINFAYPSFMPSMRGRTTSENYDLDLGFGAATWGAFTHLRLGGYYTRRWIKEEDVIVKQPAYGMLYLKQGQDDKNALMDFNRLNDGVYTPGTPAISVPIYTYDVYSITGEGTGGSFRAYRGDLGYMQDSYLENNGTSGHLGFELGAGGYGHGAINANIVLTPSSSGVWDKGNLAKQPMQFRESYKDTQAVYFKNPGEKTIPNLAWQESVGGEDLVRLKMTNVGVGSPTLVPSLVRYTDMLQRKADLPISTTASIKARDKRTQVISFLTASEADRVGLNGKISYVRLDPTGEDSNQVVFGCSNVNRRTLDRFKKKLTDLDIRKRHHVSEIDVLMQDGRKYVYDIPVYNTRQVEVTFNKKGSGAGTSPNEPVTGYIPGTDDEPGQNNQGKEGYVEKQEMPPYAHSYLLTSLLSPNYVDVKGDGITDDDMGDAIKFNYSKADSNIKWRTPGGMNQANLSEGLKTDKNDDKAHYVYGEREMWYLYSVESKNMVARFYVKNDRKDSRSVKNEEGEMDPSFGAFRLAKISLFTKGELLKNPTKPKPVKTVHFEYDYSLCQGAPGSISGYGKLTLRSIYFTYNGNNRAKKNYYRFNYPEDKNPSYSFRGNDRWGNYKADINIDPANGNPAGLTNADYPYSSKSEQKSNDFIKAWTLNQMILPSGAAINVEYEADDYAFVQDRRAANMITITGFGNTNNPSQYSPNLYESGSSINDYIYVTVPRAITATTTTAIKSQIQEWYLGNFIKNKQVYMKLAVQMPSDQNGSGYELIPIYAEIEDFGLIAGDATKTKIFIKVRRLASDYSPMMHYALQFLKSNLPSKAYPGYDVSDQGGLKAVVKSLGGLFHSFKEIFNGGMKLMINEKKCRNTDLSKSFIRFTDPYLKKPGGGIRVKKVVIHDNWDKMTKSNPNATDGMLNGTYGQEYFYTKKELVNGELMTVSSGVASWEPAMGADENPHRQAIEFYNRTPKGDYDYRIMEIPIAEMLYPSASVGYSRVETRSIHRDTVKNAAGISVSEFYTTREFPTISSFTPLSEYNAEDRYESGALDRLLKADLKSAVSLSQGFKVDLNDMNGKMRKQSTYSPNNLNDPISYTENFYSIVRSGDNQFRLNHNFPVIAGSDGKVQQSIIGREVEVMTDFREHRQQTITTNINFNVDVINGAFFPIPVPTTWKPIVRESNIYRSASILKVVNHYSMLDSVVAVDKGSMVSTKNLVYDAETGDPLLTRTNNEHNQPVYSFSYPAHWAYSGMGLAYKNIDVLYKGLTFRNGKLDATGGVDFSLFESGDELMVESQQSLGPLGISPCETFFLQKNPAKKIWAVYTGKSGSATPQWVFMDANGNPYSAANVSVRIIRSGKRNMFSAGLGSIISLNSPVNSVTGQISFTDANNIIQTAAATYKDHWRVDNSSFLFDSVVTLQQYARIKLKYYTAAEGVSIFAKYRSKGDRWIVEPLVNLNPTSMLSYRELIVEPNNALGKHTESQMVDHWLKFNLNTDPIPSGAIPYKAKLSLGSHRENHYNNYPTYYMESNHSVNTPHWNRWGTVRNRYLIPNRISVYRMSTDWPTGTTAQKDAQWKILFKDQGRNLHDWTNPVTEIQEVPAGSGWSNKNYLLNTAGDSRINITLSSVQSMLADAAANKTTAIRAFVSRGGFGGSIVDENGKGTWTSAQQCFNLGNPVSIPPVLQIYYYQCGDISISQPNPYNPGVTDTILNKLIQCGMVTQRITECRSKFIQRKSVNPYVEGIWGNWRVDTSFVYYGDRKENTIVDGTPVDTRKGGTIINYKSFWNFAALSTGILSRNFSASDVWTWNSTITQYNRKGYEIENKDPLGRFNAGLYGYNQQLPIVVANNSRYMESMFDGFEDYDYQSNSCTETCKPRRHVEMGNILPFLDGSQKHSGKQSLKLTPNQSFTFSAPVVALTSLDKSYSMRVRMDSTSYSTTVVTPNGNGIRGKYLKYSANNNNNSMVAAANTAIAGILSNGSTITRTDNQVNLQQYGSMQPPFSWGKFVARWDGFIQALETGTHYFRTFSNDGIRVWVNNVQVINQWTTGTLLQGDGNISLTKGQTYTIRVEYFDTHAGGQASLLWKNPLMSGYDIIPKEVLYLNQGDATGTVVTTNGWCTKLDSVNVRGNALTDTFTLVQNKKMLVSAWVKVGGNDCKCSTYVNNKIQISYTGGSTVSEFTPSGSIIEGWQRYEEIFEIPGTATKINVSLMNSGSAATVWFDDLRIHPFSANMKSFVYNPQTLRLMSELDENNYASFYEYDDEGTLSRVKKETAKGVKTITETRSHLQKSVQ